MLTFLCLNVHVSLFTGLQTNLGFVLFYDIINRLPFYLSLLQSMGIIYKDMKLTGSRIVDFHCNSVETGLQTDWDSHRPSAYSCPRLTSTVTNLLTHLIPIHMKMIQKPVVLCKHRANRAIRKLDIPDSLSCCSQACSTVNISPWRRLHISFFTINTYMFNFAHHLNLLEQTADYFHSVIWGTQNKGLTERKWQL